MFLIGTQPGLLAAVLHHLKALTGDYGYSAPAPEEEKYATRNFFGGQSIIGAGWDVGGLYISGYVGRSVDGAVVYVHRHILSYARTCCSTEPNPNWRLARIWIRTWVRRPRMT